MCSLTRAFLNNIKVGVTTERIFRAKNSGEYINWDEGETTTFPKLKPSTKTISLRIPETMLEELRTIANKRDVACQSSIKGFLRKN